MSERKRGNGRSADVPLVQWVVAGVALVLVLGSFALIAYEGFVRHRTPASIVVHVDSIARSGSAHRVHVRVVNEGGSTAADVAVRAQSAAGASPGSELRFQYLPAGSQARGVFLFTADPRAGDLRVEVESYREP